MKKRIWELDFLRGFAILMMVFDHFMYDLGHLDNYFSNFHQLDRPVFNWINDLAELYWISDLRFWGHHFFVALFLIISGISFTFSKSNLSRSIKLLIVAVLISLVTFLIETFAGLNIFIIFGVIHMYAFATLFTYLFRKAWDNDRFILAIGVAIIIVGFIMEFWKLNYVYELNFNNLVGIFIGTKAYGADYFGIIPYLGVIMIGTVIGNVFYKNRVSLLPHVKLSEKNIVTFTGRNSLIIFLAHQFVLLGLVFLIGLLFGYRF